MVAVFSGIGLGLERSSTYMLGARGMMGDPTLGRAGDNVYVNSSNGNLVIENQDEFLVGVGPDTAIARTYNSLGNIAGETDNWRPSTVRQVTTLTGTLNTVGSTITRIDWDGSDVAYIYDATLGVYVSNAGTGSYDTLSFDSAANVWKWTDGNSRMVEEYDWSNGGRLARQSDTDGNAATFSYDGSGQVTAVTGDNGDYVEFGYQNGNLTSLATYYHDRDNPALLHHLTRVHYDYDGANRLTSVTIDLSPDDNSIADGKVYTTTYAYDGASRRISTITQTDGSSLAIGYTNFSGTYRVTSLTETVGGISRTTSFAYDFAARATTVTDALGQNTLFITDSTGLLQRIKTPPPVSGGANRVFQFYYNPRGDITQVVDGDNRSVVYANDANGNWLSQRDDSGSTITRTYGSENQLLTETHYLVPDPDGVGPGLPDAPVTTRYVYDLKNHLRFVVSAAGDVTEYVYNDTGQQVSRIAYAGTSIDLSDLAPTDPLLEGRLITWVAGLADRSGARRTDFTYDLRGNLATETSYGALNPDGSVPASPDSSQTVYVYDQAGKLLTRQQLGSPASEHFVYDGLGRLVASTDLAGNNTTVTFNDSIDNTVVRLADGTLETSVYNSAGELISFITAIDQVSATSTYQYDALGHLRVTTDPTGVKTYFLYDADGRKVADIAADGAVVEYGYDPDDALIRTVRYATRLTGAQVSSLLDASGNPANISFETLRPAADPGDQWNWRVYDHAGRLIETIDGVGDCTLYTYDGDARLVSSTSYAAPLDGATLAGFKTTPPSFAWYPTISPSSDRTIRNFYDNNGRLIGTLDGVGALRQIVYDSAGQKVREIGYVRTPDAALWASGTFGQLLESVGPPSFSDRRSDFVYDGQGRLRFTIDAAGIASEYRYDARGNLIRTLDYAAAIQPATFSLGDVQSAVAPLSANPANRVTQSVYDVANRLAFTIDAEGAVATFAYDAAGRVIKNIAFASSYSASGDPTLGGMQSWAGTNSSAGDRVRRTVYDPLGRVGFEIDPEGFVTRHGYDAAGRITTLTSYADRYSIADGATFASVAALIGSPPGAAVTSYAYDAAGRLTDTSDAEGSVTHFDLDALGEITATTVAYGTSDASTTARTFDGAGRVLSETRGSGSGESVTISYGYDALGNLTTVDDEDGRITRRIYDAMGRVIQLNVPLNPSTVAISYFEHDAFGNLVKTTDPRGNASFSYYDKLNRLTLAIDAEGYATESSYDVFGDLASVTRRASPTSGTPTVSTPPTIVIDGDHDALTGFSYDRNGRLTDTTDAEGHSEHYTLDAFGNRTQVTNKLGGVTTNSFDRRGLLISEELPMASVNNAGTTVASSVTNTFTYDARGNRTKMVEAAGLAEQRTTTYEYDRLNRLVQKSGERQTVWTFVEGTGWESTTCTPAEHYSYDLRGNVIKTETIAAEAPNAPISVSYRYYDDLDRKTAEVSAVGTLSTYAYDVAGNIVATRVYASAVTPPSDGSVPLPAPGDSFRETSFTYDYSNRLTSTTINNVRVGRFDGTNYTTEVAAQVTSSSSYDSAGNIKYTLDARGNYTYFYYDRLDRKLAEVDANKYLTTWNYDAEGNVTRETRFATQLTITPLNAATPVADLIANAGAAPDDRTTAFAYDRNGRRLTETRLAVSAASIDSNGSVTPGVTDSTVNYAYNGLGQVSCKTEATGDLVHYAYDLTGRLVEERRASYTDQAGVSVTPTVNYAYNGLNDLSRTEQVGTANAATRVTTYAYGAGGHLDTMVDGAGAAHCYKYDIAGRVVAEGAQGTDRYGNLQAATGASHAYDAAGRLIYQSVVRWNGAGLEVAGDEIRFQYNSFGEVAKRGVNGLWQETFDYDGAGHLWRSSAGDGVTRVYLYDGSGNQTLVAASNGTSNALSSATDIVSALGLTGTGFEYVTAASLPDLVLTFTTYDKRDRQTQIWEARRETTAIGSAFTAITTSQSYNAFGEVATTTDALNNVTSFSYNGMGRLTRKVMPQVSVTSTSGLVSTVNPTENYYYDVSGRLIATLDANGSDAVAAGGSLRDHAIRRTLLAGTGYGGSDAQVTAEFHPDGVARTQYDVFGDARTLTDENELDEIRSYDGMGRLIEVDRRTGLVEHYGYDASGQRIRHSNNALAGDREITEYDAQGRVIYARAFGGDETSTSFVWDATVATALGTSGGWTKTTTEWAQLGAGAKTKSETTDVHGLTTAETDLGGNVTSYTYDKAGRLIQKVGTTGYVTTTLDYTYFNTGNVATITDSSAGVLAGYGINAITSTFAYDAMGRRTREKYAGTVYKSVSDTTYDIFTSGQQTRENAIITYDALGRLASFTSLDSNGAVTVTVNQYYDASGNIRHTATTYPNLVGGGTTSSDKWFAYDSLNRMVIADGALVDGAIETTDIAGAVTLSYDAAGNRKTAATKHSEYVTLDDGLTWRWITQTDTQTYNYDGDNQVTTVLQNGSTIASTNRDLLGRVTQYIEYAAGAPGGIASERYNILYNARGQVTSENSFQWINGATDMITSTTNQYDAYGNISRTDSINSGAKDTWQSWAYAWRDGAVVSSSQFDKEARDSTNRLYNSWQYYDGLGRLQRAVIADGKPRAVNFALDADGHVLSSVQNDGTANDPREIHLFASGVQVADDTNNNGAEVQNYDYQALITDKTVPGESGSGRFWHGSSYGSAGGEFGTSGYDPVNQITAGVAQNSRSSYTVQAGDTFQSIARDLWGDSSLWYKIADANGLGADSQLVAGRSLAIPLKGPSNSNNASMYRPYDAASAVGDLSPTSVKPPKSGKCGAFGQVLLVAIAVAVTAIIAGPASAAIGAALNGGAAAAAGSAAAIAGGIVGGALAGAAGSIISQGFGVATGIQQQFSWKGVALSALAGGIGAGVATAAPGGGILGAAARGAASSALTQGIAVVTGLQDKFDWAGVAAAGVGAGAAASLGTIPGYRSLSGFNQRLFSSMASDIADAASRSVIQGSDFGDNLIAALPDVLGQTIGGLIADGVSGRTTGAPAATNGDGEATGSTGQTAQPDTDAIVVNQKALQAAMDRVFGGISAEINEIGDPALASAHDAIRESFAPTYDEVSASASPVLGATAAHYDYDASTGSPGSYDGVTPVTGRPDFLSPVDGLTIGNVVDVGDGTATWVVNEQRTAAMNAALANFDKQVGIAVGAPIAAGGLLAVVIPALPSVLQFAGYEGGTGLIAQSVGVKAGIGLSIELGGNYATSTKTSIGGVTGTLLASTLIAPSATRIYGIGVKGLTIAGAAFGGLGNLAGQGIDYLSIGRAFDRTEFLLSTGLGALGGRLAAPLQDRFGATSLLFRKYSPAIEELFFAPTTASGAAADVSKKLVLKHATSH